jgi:hypothetical protein
MKEMYGVHHWNGLRRQDISTKLYGHGFGNTTIIIERSYDAVILVLQSKRNMKYAIEIISYGIIYISCFMEIDRAVQAI